MTRPIRHSIAQGLATLSLGLAALPAMAQTPLLGNYTLIGDLCVGEECGLTESFGNFPLKLKADVVGIHFDDTSTAPGEPAIDWRILINDSMPYGEDSFTIQDGQTGAKIFRLEAYAPSNAIYVNDEGWLGFGTSMPSAHLHMRSGDTPSLRFEQDNSNTYDPQTWDLLGNEIAFALSDETNDTQPFRVIPGTGNDDALVIESNGEIGIGTANPETTLHLRRGGGDTQLKIEETSGTQTARPLLNMINHGRPDIIMANTATGGEWAFGAGTNFVLKNGAVGSSDGDKNLQFKLYGATGNLEIAGQIITGGPTCASGCDAVFSESYDLPSIQEHAAAMFSLGHLPNVGPTAPNQPVNMSEQYGKLLNELEHAHIYIATLERENAGQNERLTRQSADIADLAARLRALEKSE